MCKSHELAEKEKEKKESKRNGERKEKKALSKMVDWISFEVFFMVSMH